MENAFIAIGSNINPSDNIEKALRLLSQHVTFKAISTVYKTPPLDRPEQPPYYNCVVKIETVLTPENLRNDVLHEIEDSLGRKRGSDKYASRTIDLDLIIYDDMAIKTDDIILPDPQINERPFFAFPLYELEPGLILSGANLPIADITSKMSAQNMEPLKDYTKQLKQRIFGE